MCIVQYVYRLLVEAPHALYTLLATWGFLDIAWRRPLIASANDNDVLPVVGVTLLIVDNRAL